MTKGKERRDKYVSEVSDWSEKKPPMAQLEEPEKRAEQWENIHAEQAADLLPGCYGLMFKLWGHPPGVSG